MAWNEPGSDKNKDPWSSGNRQNDQQPPDLDEVLRKMQERLNNVFGGRGNRKSRPENVADIRPPSASRFGVGLIIAVLLAIYVLSGIYIVKPAERAVVFQFGRYVKEVGPGPHWVPLFIRSKEIVNVERIMDSTHSSRMLTSDENIIVVQLAVQYKVNNLPNYLFNVIDPNRSLKEATDSAIRQVVGQSTLDDVLTERRSEIRDEIRKQIEETLAIYQSGLLITDVNLQPARPPEEVKDAFDDAIKAQEDEERLINLANAYRRRVLPTAEGQSQRILADARAYGAEVKLRAQADIERFNRLLPQYKNAPEVTRERLYLDTMEKVLGRVSKIVIDNPNGQQVMYLPLDQFMKKSSDNTPPVNVTIEEAPMTAAPAQTNQPHDAYSRSRERR
ncbi:MAG: FtsH protease activity modulator HflK [Gammaproteobacteria bacterium]|jgi:membrane protease subunit HflK